MSAARHLRGPLGFVLLLVVLRVVFLVAGMDPSEERVFSILAPVMLEWPDGPVRSLFDREELYTSTAAQAIGLGLDLPVSLYRFMPYGAGSQLLSLAAIPVISLFGSSYLAFKLIPLLVTVLGGLCWFLAVRRWLGARSGWIFGLLYILAPPVLVRVGLIAKGDHAEAMAYVGLVLFSATGAALGMQHAARLRWALLTGLLAGFGVFLTYSTVPVLLGVGIAALIRTRLRPRNAWLIFALGGVLGLVPWLVTVVGTGGEALTVYGQPLGSLDLGVAWQRVELLFNEGLAAGYDLPGRATRSVAAIVWVLAVLLGWIRCIRHLRHPVPMLLLAGTLVHLAAFCLRAPDPSPRYLIPGYPLFLISVTFLATGLLEGRRASRLGLAVVGVVLILGLASQVRVVAASHVTALRRPLGATDWPLLGEIAGQKLPVERIRALPDPVRPHFWVGLGKRHGFRTEPDEWSRMAASIGEERFAFWRGVGYGLNESGRALNAPTHLLALPQPDRVSLRDGLAATADYVFAGYADRQGPEAVRILLTSYAEEDRPDLRRSLARALGVLATHDILSHEMLDRMAQQLLDQEERDFGAGYSLYRDVGRDGSIIQWMADEDAWTVPVALELARGKGSLAAWKGVAAAYEEDLAYRDPRWILGGAEGPRDLAAELNRVARHVPSGAVDEFYIAAGRTAARALGHPEIATRGELTCETWPWASVIPRPFLSAFEEGLHGSAQ